MELINGLIIIILISLIFLICREIVCWYWKINRMVEQNGHILERLDYLARKEGFQSKSEFVSEKISVADEVKKTTQPVKTSKPPIKFYRNKLNKRKITIFGLLIAAIIVLVTFIILLKINPFLPSLGRYMFPHILD